jgi:ribose 5-phosphate isomerase
MSWSLSKNSFILNTLTYDRASFMDKLLKLVCNHDTIGIGEGPFIKNFLDALALTRAAQLPVLVCASSHYAQYARELGFYVQSWRGAQHFEIMIDHVDYVSHQGFYSFGSDNLIKERNIVSFLAKRMAVIADRKHYVEGLAHHFYAEVMPQASSIAARACLKIDARLDFIDKYTVDNNWIMQLHIDHLQDYTHIIDQLNAIPGLLDYGLSTKVADHVYLYSEMNFEELSIVT